MEPARPEERHSPTSQALAPGRWRFSPHLAPRLALHLAPSPTRTWVTAKRAEARAPVRRQSDRVRRMMFAADVDVPRGRDPRMRGRNESGKVF